MNKFFVFNPNTGEFETFATQKDANEAAEFLAWGYSEPTGEWTCTVEYIISGVITHKATKITKNPKEYCRNGVEKTDYRMRIIQ